MSQLRPTIDDAVAYTTEIDLYWNNDPRATEVLLAPTGQTGNASFNSCPITGLTPGTVYTFTIDNTAPGYAAGSAHVQVMTLH